jgi:hypothetical protein
MLHRKIRSAENSEREKQAKQEDKPTRGPKKSEPKAPA